MLNEIVRRARKDALHHVEELSVILFEGEVNAHHFIIEPPPGESFASYTDVTGFFVRPDRRRVTLAGTIDHTTDKAILTLSSTCYAVPGRYRLTIFAMQADADEESIVTSETTAIYACQGFVQATQGGEAAGGVEPIVEPVDASMFTSRLDELTAALAPSYDQLDYPISAGAQHCWYDGKYYVAVADIAEEEEWTAAHWQETDIDSALADASYGVDELEASTPYYWGTYGASVTANGLTITQEGPYLTVDGTATADTYVKLDGTLALAASLAAVRAMSKTRVLPMGSRGSLAASISSGDCYYLPEDTSSSGSGTTPVIPTIVPPGGYPTYAIVFWESASFNKTFSPQSYTIFELATSARHEYMIYACFYNGTVFKDCKFHITTDNILADMNLNNQLDRKASFSAGNLIAGTLVPSTSMSIISTFESNTSSLSLLRSLPTGLSASTAKHGVRISATADNVIPYIQFGQTDVNAADQSDAYPVLAGLSRDTTYTFLATVNAKLFSDYSNSATRDLKALLYVYTEEEAQFMLCSSETKTILSWTSSTAGTEQTVDFWWQFKIPYWHNGHEVKGFQIRFMPDGIANYHSTGDFVELVDTRLFKGSFVSTMSSAAWKPAERDIKAFAAWVTATDAKIATLEAQIAALT